MDATVNPVMWLVADHLSPDVGEDGGYDADMRFLLPDLDFGEPDRVKYVNEVEVVYESLREVPITIEIFRRAPLTDPGTSSESASVSTQAEQSEEPGVFWGNSSPDWDSESYATYKIYSASAHFTYVQGKSFNIGFAITCDLTPVRILEVLIKFHHGKASWKASGTEFAS